MAVACSVVRRADVQEYADDDGEGAATSGSARNAGVLQKLEPCLDGDAVDDDAAEAAVEAEAEAEASAEAAADGEADDASCKRSGGVAGWGEGDCVSDDELSEAGDPARAGEAAQAGSAGPALSLAFAVAREWAGRARALGLALVVLEPVLEPALEPVLLELVWAASAGAAAVEPGPRALSGPWNHLSALCIAASFTGQAGFWRGGLLDWMRYSVHSTRYSRAAHSLWCSLSLSLSLSESHLLPVGSDDESRAGWERGMDRSNNKQQARR